MERLSLNQVNRRLIESALNKPRLVGYFDRRWFTVEVDFVEQLACLLL